jgi:hypothetical protein
VLDRASTFADPEIIRLLKTRFIPVAIDQGCQRRQQDSEGEFYRKIAGQGPRNDFQSTTQGLYIAAPDGKLLAYNNNRGPDRIRRLMKTALSEFQENLAGSTVAVIRRGEPDRRYNPQPPQGGLVVRVRAKVIDGYEPTADRWLSIFQTALSRDNLWISSSEHQAVARGELPLTLQSRIARFHLVDNTRGEPPMWKKDEVRYVGLALKDGRLTGKIRLAADNGKRGYDAELLGVVEVEDGEVTRFDAVALGRYWGEGPYTPGAPSGEFRLAVSFELADGSDPADQVPPEGSRGWVRGYIR